MYPFAFAPHDWRRTLLRRDSAGNLPTGLGTLNLPAGTVRHIDHAAHVDDTKDQIKNPPEYDPATGHGPDYPTASAGTTRTPTASSRRSCGRSADRRHHHEGVGRLIELIGAASCG
jgi:hypothetical protein